MTHAPSPTHPWPPGVADWPEADRRLLDRVDPARVPRHVAIIMDGNGRWAARKGWRERIRGHEVGAEAVRETTRTCVALGARALTLYAFSMENWRRPAAEIAALMKLLERFCVQERGELMDNDVRLTTIGDVDRLPASTRAKLDETIALTRDNRGTALVLALSYGARDEIARAARRLAREAAEGRVDPERIDEAAFAARLDTAGLPDPDLLVRTSGEMRLSNFLLWQLAYAELHVTDVLWPDFRRRHLLEAVIDYQGRERRFGGVDSTDVEPPAASNPPA